MDEHPEEELLDAYVEWSYRRLVGGITHQEYLDEPAPMAEWFTAFEGLANG
jgi:hypothetical protein